MDGSYTDQTVDDRNSENPHMNTKKNTKIIWLIVVGVALLALICAALLYLFVWSQPTKADFKNAQTGVGALNKSYATLTERSQEYLAKIGTSLDASSKEALAYNRALSEHKEKFDELSSSKVMNNKKVGSAFDSLKKKDTLFVSYTDGYIVLQRSVQACSGIFRVTIRTSKVNEISSAHRVQAQKCLPELNRLSESDTKLFADFGKTFTSVVNERQKIFDAVSKGSMEPQDASVQIDELSARFKKAADINNELLTARSESSVTYELKALQDALKQQEQQAK